MTDAVATQVLHDGARNAVVKLTNVSDGTGEAAVLKVDVSTLQNAPSRVSIERIQATTAGMGFDLLWDATTDVVALSVGPDQVADLDFKEIGGLHNNAGTGVTGDIMLTTFGHSAGDRYTVILHMKKG
jgi:hypothetical protein